MFILRHMKKCILWFHDWENWKDDRVVELTKTEMLFPHKMETTIEGIMMVQKRRCSRCNKIQLANIKTK